MKHIALFLLSFYQKILSPFLHHLFGVRQVCRYSPTCSEYAKIHITSDGVIKGSAKSLLRILYCNPFVQTLPPALQK